MFLGLAFFLTLLLTRSYLVNSDEGYTLNAAWQLWNGMKMYDDFRLFVGPGSGYAIYLLWHLIGSPSFLAARLLSLAFSFSATTAIYMTLREIGVRGTGLVFAIAIWLSASSLYVPLNHNSFSTFAATWFLLLFLRVARKLDGGIGDKHRTRDHVLVGVAAGTVFIFLQTKGLLLASAGTAFVFLVGFKKRDFRPALALMGGFLAVVAPLFAIWRPSVLVREWFIVPLTGNYLGHTGASTGIAVACLALTCGMGWMAMRRADRVLQALAVTQAALIASMTHNMELHHLAINVFPAIVFGMAVVNDRITRDGRTANLSSEIAMAIVVAIYGLFCVATPVGTEYFRSSTLYVDLLGRESRILFSSPRIAEAHAIYAGPFLPGLYFQLDKKNPYFVSETIVCNQECQHRLVGQLSTTKPELAFLQYEMVRHLGYDENSPVDVYLREHYTLCTGDYYGGMIVRASEARWCP
ncbi:MAG TPA: glycosyltransferase family 39 protein [Polyangia bacterium]